VVVVASAESLVSQVPESLVGAIQTVRGLVQPEAACPNFTVFVHDFRTLQNACFNVEIYFAAMERQVLFAIAFQNVQQIVFFF